MTKNEHAIKIRSAMRAVERAQAALHKALAEAVREFGAELSLGDDVIASAAPKIPPPDPQ